jgi:RNA-directed DNA polymerase
MYLAAKTRRLARTARRVVLTSQGQLSLGRDRKRQISAMVHRYIARMLSDEEIAALKGFLAFAHDVEPRFVVRLGHKYTWEIILSIQGFRP